MQKTELPNLTISYLVLELKPIIENAFVNKVQELENNWLKFKLHSDAGSKDLIVSPQAMFLTNYSISAKMETKGFGELLKKHLSNKKVLKIFQHDFDRIIVFEFNDFFLIFEFFAKGNIALTDKAYKILGVLRREKWKDRELSRGAPYKFPTSRGKNPSETTIMEFQEIFSKDSSVVLSLINGMNVSPIFAEEICHIAGISKESSAKNLSKKQIEELFAALNGFYSKVSEKNMAPCVVETISSKILLPFSLKSMPNFAKVDSLSNALDELLSKNSLEFGKGKEKELVADKKAKELEYSVMEQKKAIETLEKTEIESKEKGEKLFLHYVEVKSLLDAISRGKAFGLKENEIFSKINKVSTVLKELSFSKGKAVIELD